MCKLWKITYVFTQGSISSKANSQSTPDTFPTVSPNRGHNARGGMVLPPFIAGDIHIGRGWHRVRGRDCIRKEYRHQMVSIHDGTLGLKHAGSDTNINWAR